MQKENRLFAMSDIHGCGKTFIAMLDRIEFNKTDTLVLVGDLIDRGPNTKLLLDEIFRLNANGYNVLATKGNHEDMMIKREESDDKLRTWLANGGDTVLKDFGVKSYSEISINYRNYIENIPLYLEIEKYIFVHAGIDNYNVDPFKEYAALWRRKWTDFLKYDWLGNRIIIHGHTPRPVEQIIKSYEKIETKQYLNIDAGCAYVNFKEGGNLCAIDLTNNKLHFEKCIDAVDAPKNGFRVKKYKK